MIKALIPEDIPSQNKGEAALFFGLRESLRPYGAVSLAVFSTNKELDEENYKDWASVIDASGTIPAHILDGQATSAEKICNYLIFVGKHALYGCLWMIFRDRAAKIMTGKVWHSYSEADVILMGHDSFYAPVYHGVLALLFKLMNKPSVIYAGTIKRRTEGPHSLKSRLVKALMVFTLRAIPLITLREALSLEHLRELGLERGGPDIRVYPDLAFLLPMVSQREASKILEAESCSHEAPIIGMAISQRKLDFAFPGQVLSNRSERALGAIVELVDYLANTLGATIVFIPHSIGPSSVLDDRITANMIRNRSRCKERLHVLNGEYTPQQLKGIASLLDMTIGTRLHFTIDAVCSGIPSILITHNGDFRCHGIVGHMLGMSKYVYNIDDIEADSLTGLAVNLWENRESVTEYLRKKVSDIRGDVYNHGEAVIKLVSRRNGA